MKAIPTASPTLGKRVRRPGSEGPGTVVQLTHLGVVQAIRLPKELRFDADAVRLIRDGDRLIVEPLPRAAALPPLPGREPPAASGPRPRRRAPDGDSRAPSPVGPTIGGPSGAPRHSPISDKTRR